MVTIKHFYRPPVLRAYHADIDLGRKSQARHPRHFRNMSFNLSTTSVTLKVSEKAFELSTVSAFVTFVTVKASKLTITNQL